MNPQKHLNDLFLKDLIEHINDENIDAVNCFMRLRLYLTVTQCGKTMRELLKEYGVTSAQYDLLLQKYNRQLANTV